MEQVARQARQLKRACGKRDAEWGELSNAITELADAVEALPDHDHREAIKEHLQPLAEELEELLRNIRSKLVSDVCEQLGRIVKATRLAFAPLANLLLQGLADTAKASSIAIRDPGFRLFSDVSEYSRYDLEALHKVYRNSPQERVRVLVHEQLQLVLTYWPKREVEPCYNDVLELLRRGMLDPSSIVRTACRQTFCSFSDLWKERVDELVDVPPSRVRELLIKEKPHATISKAMQHKYGTTPSKSARADSVSALRQQRAASKRPGTAASDDAFIEVTESPRRPLQRPTVDASKRGVSPGRTTPRAPSPSSATIGATRQRVPSPPSTGRSASPGVTPRSASPLFGAARPPLVDAARSGRAHTVSPGRPDQVSSPRVNGNGLASEMSGAVPAESHLGEFNRYLSLTAHEKMESKREADASTSAPRGNVQKRVSIAAPPTATDLTRALSFSDALPSIQRGAEAKQGTAPPSWTSAAPAGGSSRLEPPSSAPSFAVRNPQAATIAAPGAGSTTSYAAAAHSFVAQSHPLQWRCAQPPDAKLTSQEGPRDSAPDSADQRPPNGVFAAETRGAPTVPRDGRFVGSKPDAFLDRPIPSSAPAPEPRASTNVTTRGRRPPSFQSASRAVVNGTDEVKPPVPVAAAPVPETPRHQVPRPRFLDETFPPPPSASLDAAFLQSNMASAAPVAGESDANRREDVFFEGGDDENKENVGVGQENAAFLSALKQREAPGADAISVLGALRGNLRATHEKLATAHAAPPLKSQYTPPPKPTQSDVKVPTTFPSTQPLGQTKESVNQASFQTPHLHKDHGQEKRSAPVPTNDDRPQLPSAPAPAKQERRPPGLQLKSVAATAQPKKSPPAEAANPWASSAHATGKPSSPVAGGQLRGAHQPPTDFIRAATPFTFAALQPPLQRRQQQLRAPASAPQVCGLAPGATNARPMSAPGISQQNERGLRHHDHHERDDSPPSIANQDAGLRRRHPPAESSPVHAGVDTAAAKLSSDTPSSAFARRHTVLNPQPQRVHSNVLIKMLYSFGLVLVAIFGLSGLIEAVTKVRNAYEYHQSLLDRINQFETSIVESYESVRKMNEKYAVWSEYVRELAEQDESNALHQLESIQTEVEKWQREMKTDLLEFKQSLSGDIIDAALAPLRTFNGSSLDDQPAT